MKDKELFERYKKLYSAVLADSLDMLLKPGMITKNHCMDYRIRPLTGDIVIVGRAMTILSSKTEIISERPFDKLLEALDDIKKGEIIVTSLKEDDIYYGSWGELCSNAAKARGSNGAIIDGLTRDAREIKKINFPVFAKGFTPNDANGRNKVVDFRCDINCGGINVSNGDLIYADYEGVVVIPKGWEEKVLIKAEKKFKGENIARKEFAAGKSTIEVFNKYGVL